MTLRSCSHALAHMTLAVTVLSGCGSDGTTSNPGGAGTNVGGSATGANGGTSGAGGASGGAGASGGSAGSGGSDAASDAPSDAVACKLSKPYSSKNASCNACAEKECCALINVCYADQDCDDGYVNCILACALLPGDAGDAGVASCLADCAAQHPTGKAEYDAAIGCADTQCAAPCG